MYGLETHFKHFLDEFSATFDDLFAIGRNLKEIDFSDFCDFLMIFAIFSLIPFWTQKGTKSLRI